MAHAYDHNQREIALSPASVGFDTLTTRTSTAGVASGTILPTDKVCPGRTTGTIGFRTGKIATLCLTCLSSLGAG